MCLHLTSIIACESNIDDYCIRSWPRSSSDGHWRWWRCCLVFPLAWMTRMMVVVVGGLIAGHVELPRQLEKGQQNFLYLNVSIHHL